jgi:hypothetical protein
MVTTAIGVGVLLLPSLYTHIGYVQGIIYTFLAAFMLGFMCVVYVWSLELARGINKDPKQRLFRMEDLAEFCFARWFFWVVIIVVNFTAFAINLTFHILLGDLLNGMARLGHGSDRHSAVLWKLICVAPLTLVCLPKDMRIIARFGFVGVVGVVVVIVAMTIASVQALSHHEAHGTAQAFVKGQTVKDALDGLSTFVFSCGCLLVIPALFEDMGDGGGRKKLPMAITAAHITIVVVFLAVAVPGYAAFGVNAPAQFLDPNGPVHRDHYGAWLAGSIAVLLHSFIVYPLLMNGPIRAIEDFLPNKWYWRLGIRSALVWATFGLACTPVSFFADIVSLVPASTSGVFALIWPPFFYWKLLFMKHGSVAEVLKPTKRKFELALHIAIIIVAIIAIIMGIWGAIDSLIVKLQKDSGAPTNTTDVQLGSQNHTVIYQ